MYGINATTNGLSDRWPERRCRAGMACAWVFQRRRRHSSSASAGGPPKGAGGPVGMDRVRDISVGDQAAREREAQ
jgi:hypothetical protein